MESRAYIAEHLSVVILNDGRANEIVPRGKEDSRRKYGTRSTIDTASSPFSDCSVDGSCVVYDAISCPYR